MANRRRVRYRFVGRSGDRYVWESVTPVPGDSRHEPVRCSIDWFWGKKGAKEVSKMDKRAELVNLLRVRLDQDEHIIFEAAEADVDNHQEEGAVGTFRDRWRSWHLMRDIEAKRATLSGYEFRSDPRSPGYNQKIAEGLWVAIQLMTSAYAHLPGFREMWPPPT